VHRQARELVCDFAREDGKLVGPEGHGQTFRGLLWLQAMLGEDDPTAPTPKLAPAPGTPQHALEHCRALRDGLQSLATALAGLREEIDRSLREIPPTPVPASASDPATGDEGPAQ
jgi:hypothetical protein